MAAFEWLHYLWNLYINRQFGWMMRRTIKNALRMRWTFGSNSSFTIKVDQCVESFFFLSFVIVKDDRISNGLWTLFPSIYNSVVLFRLNIWNPLHRSNSMIIFCNNLFLISFCLSRIINSMRLNYNMSFGLVFLVK